MPLTRPNDLVAFDMDGDGDNDLATANFQGGSVSLLRNDGVGGFLVSGTVAVGAQPVSLAAGDLDADGDADLVVALYTLPGSLALLRNQGGGSFVVAGSVTGVNRPADVVIGAFAAGAALDIAVANQGATACSGTVTVHPGLGGLTFGAPTPYAVGCTPWQITAAQLDNANGVDLATTNDQSATVSILASNSGGTFQPAVSVAVPTVPNGIAARDMDLDGRVDLVVGNRGGPTVAVLWNNGALSFTAASFTAGFAPTAVAGNTLGCDGLPDIVVANDNTAATATVTVLEGLGARTFAAGVTFTVGGDPRAIVVASLDNSPHLDLATANTNQSSVSILRANSAGSGPTITQQPPTTWTNCNGVWITISVVATGSGSLSYQWFKNAAPISGATASTLTVPAPGPGDSGAYTCQVTDSCGTVTSNACQVLVGGAPTITQQPVGATVCANTTATLTVAATSLTQFPITDYRWFKIGTGFLAEGAPYTGTHLPTLTINPTSAATAGQYLVWVHNACNFVQSSTVTLNVNPVTAIPTWPANQTVCEGSPLTLTFTAVGGTPLDVEWRNPQGGVPSISTTLNLAAATLADSGTWRCVAASPCGGLVEQTFVLTVIPRADPISAAVVPPTVCAGAGGTITLTATGGGGQDLRWYSGSCGGTFVGTGTPLTIPAPTGDTLYFARWESSSCTPTNCVSTSVTVLSVPPNDACANPLSAVLGTNAYVTTCATDSAPTGCTIKMGVFHAFTLPACGTLIVSTSGASLGYTPAFSIYRDGCNGELLACSSAGTATISAEAGAQLLIHTGSLDGSSGSGSLDLAFLALTPITNDEATAAELIPVGTPSSTLPFDSTCATDSVASGCLVKKDVWFRYDALTCNDVTLTVVGAAFPPAIAVYDGADCSSASLTACGTSPLAFQAQSGHAYNVRVGSSLALGGPASLVVSSTPCGGCSSCPPNTTPERIQVYTFTGPANGTSWSWSISSSVFCGLTQLHTPGVATGTACDVAARFADSINLAGCGTGRLYAVPGCILGTGGNPDRGTLTIHMGGNQPFTLRTGPDCQAPNCTLSIFGGCTVNPFVIEIPLANQDCNQNGVDDVVDVA
ncbi:MAG: VCBS repeat-containing protein [Planctomycetes bacterium]|nr:VCBS repeat-containing protein [Planctomycetota bacterium]